MRRSLERPRNEGAVSDARGKASGSVPPLDLLPSEDWAWQTLRNGNVADFHVRLGDIDPAKARAWDQTRQLRPEFLKCLTFAETFRSQLPPQGVRIIGAWISGSLDLNEARLTHPWRIERSRIDGKVCLPRAQTVDDLSFQGTCSAGYDLAAARVGGSLDLSSASVAGAVDLRQVDIGFHILFAGLSCRQLTATGARIGRAANLDRIRCDDLSMQDVITGAALHLVDANVATANLKRARFSGHANLNGLKCEGPLELEGVDIGSDLFLNYDVSVGDLGLAGARVQGQVSLDGVTCEGRVNLNGLGLREDLILSNGRLNTLDAIGVVCGGQLNMEGLTCSGEANFQSLQVSTDVLMKGSKFSAGFGLMSAKIGADLLMRDAEFGGDVDLQAMQVSGDVLMPGAKFSAELNLRNASIGLNLGMPKIRAQGPIVMIGAHAGTVRLAEAECTSVNMRFLEIDDFFDATGTRLSALLDMSSSQIGHDIFFQGDASFSDIDLSDAKVGGTIVARRVRFHGKVKAHWAIAGYVWLHADAWFENAVEFDDARIDDSFELGGAHIEQLLSLAGCRIGSLVIGSVEHGFPSWCSSAELNLGDATSRTLEVADNAEWPTLIALGGFTYERIPGSNHEWLKNWLERDPHYTAQSYRQAARVLTTQDEARLADRILFQGRERQRRISPPLQRATDWVAKLTIGYGIGNRYFYSLGWAALLTVVGAWVFSADVYAQWNHPGASVLFSLEELLPIIDVSPGADDIAKRLTGGVHWYLAFHRGSGFLLGTFIIAGLTGLTKR